MKQSNGIRGFVAGGGASRRLALTALVLGLVLSFHLLFQGCGLDNDFSEVRGAGPTFVTVSNSVGSSVSIFRVDPASGGLIPLDNVILPSWAGPTMTAIHPNRKFMVVVNSGAPEGSWQHNGCISVYRFDAATGAVAEVEGSPFRDNSIDTPVNAAFSPDGRHLYVTDQVAYQVHVFDVDLRTGALAPLEVVDSLDTHGIAVHPTGRFVFDGSETDGIRTWTVNSDNGSLTLAPGSPYDSPGYNVFLAVNPDGRFLYSAAITSLNAFSIDPGTGALTPVQSLEFPRQISPKGIVVDPGGRYVYTANFDDGSIGAYAIDPADGSLAPIPPRPYASGRRPKSVGMTASGEYLYCANFGDNNVRAFRVNPATGALTRIGDFPTGPGPKHLLVFH
jgi:6-phosphogluconolactonase (cycloisomerase 2 family)